MAEGLYLANAVKAYLNSAWGFNFTLLQFGGVAAARRAEMAQTGLTAEYLGQRVAGGFVEGEVNKILAHASASVATSTSTAAATAATTAARALSTAQRAESMDLRALLHALLALLLAPLNILWILLWTWLCTFLLWTAYLALTIPFILLAYLALYVLSLPRVFATVQRGVWLEDFDAAWALSRGLAAAATALRLCLAAAVVLPFRLAAAGARAVRASAGWADACDLWRRGKRALGREWERALLDLRYNAVTDWLRFRYWLVTHWLERHALRILLLAVLLAVGWRLVVRAREREEVVYFESVEAMGAHFGIPRHFFEFDHAQRASRPETWVAGAGGDVVGRVEDDAEMVWLGDGVAEERMATGHGVSASQTEEVAGEETAETSGMGGESAGMVQKRAMGEGEVGYCRQCRQRHCCEAVDGEPAATTLFLGH